MRYMTVLLAVATAATFACPAGAGETVGFKVVVHADNPTEALARGDVARIFMAKVERWEGRTPIVVVDQLADSEIRKQFSRTVLLKTPTAIRSYWQRQIFSGRSVPPPELASDALVLDFVAADPRAIGYVSAAAPMPQEVKALDVLELEGYDAKASSAGTHAVGFDSYGDTAGASAGARINRASSKDETVSRHGDLRLFLTGSCGPAGEGRQAILENRDPDYAVSAEIETSVWNDERLRASSVSHHTVGPLEEERLGCTRRSGDTERRYAIVRASSATSHVVDHQPHRPPRSVIAIVDAGSCGQQRAGTWRSVINRHTSREVSVSIEFREMVGDKLRRRYLKHHRLAPGATQRLGCSADGPMTRQFTVLEARYR